MIKKIGWKKQLYIATRIKVETDDYGNDVSTFDTPKSYMFNYQPANGGMDIQLYGERTVKMYKAVIPYNLYAGKFNEGDVAYLEGVNPTGETQNGDNANYTVVGTMPQNKVIILYFEKIIK